MSTRDLESALKAAKRYKYLFAFLVLAVVLTVDQFAPPIPYQWLESFRVALLSSTITGVIIALFYDLFVARQQDAQAKLDRELFAAKVAEDLLSRRAAELMSDDDILALLKNTERKDGLAKALASLVVEDEQLQPAVKRSYLRPIFEPPRYFALKANHRFQAHDPEHYLWRCRHTVTSLNPNINFRLFVCEDKQIAADITNAGGAADFVLFLSEGDRSGIGVWDINSISFSAETLGSGRRDGITLEIVHDNSEISNRIGREIEEHEGRMYYIRATEEHQNPTLTMGFDQLLAYDDPFFCWTSEDYCFVESVVVDYHDVAEEFGDVTVLNYIGSQSGSLDHDHDRGMVEMRVNDLVGPGDGFVIIMRRNK